MAKIGINYIGRVSISAREEGGKRFWGFENGDAGPFETFARTGAGRAFESDGTMVAFLSDAPRITSRGLLLEPQATNLLRRSRDLTMTPWSATGGSAVALEGNFYGVAIYRATVTGPSGSPFQRVQQVITDQPVGAYVASFFAMENSEGFIQGAITTISGGNGAPTLSGGTSGSHRFNYNPSTGLFFNTHAALSCLANLIADNLYQIEVAYTLATSPSAGQIYNQLHDSNSGTTGAYGFWGAAQLETGSRATSFILTAGSAGTRGADAATLAVPKGCTQWDAVYGDGRTVVGGSGLTPGASFDLIAGRPWIGLGNELKSVRFAP